MATTMKSVFIFLAVELSSCVKIILVYTMTYVDFDSGGGFSGTRYLSFGQHIDSVFS